MNDSRADEKVAALQGEVDNLNYKIAFLEQRLKELEQNRSIPRNPWDVVGPGIPPVPAPVFEVKKSCTKCGIRIDGVMGYVCPDGECPCRMASAH